MSSIKPQNRVKAIDNVGKSGIINNKPLSKYLNSSDVLYKNAQKIKPIDGYEDMIIHGDRYGFEIRNKDGKIIEEYTVREFAEILKGDPNYHGGNIRLISCETGADDLCADQMLSNQLGVDVIAPTDIVWVTPEGDLIVGPTEFESTGRWRKFKPKE